MLGRDVVNTFQGVPWLPTLSWYLVSNIHSAKGEELGSRLRVLGGLLEMVKFRELAIESLGHSGSDKGSPGAMGSQELQGVSL